MKRKCSTCQKVKDTSAFHRNKGGPDKSGFDNECKECRKKRIRPKEARHAEYMRRQRVQKNYDLKKHYGITLDDYNELLAKQDSLCAICGKHASESNKGLHVDHCHERKIVRGLLCNSCNLAIGQLKHNVTILNKAIAYLQAGQ